MARVDGGVLKFDWLDGRRIVFASSSQAGEEPESPTEECVPTGGRPWRRVLYERQAGYADNFVPASILRRLTPKDPGEEGRRSLADTAKWTAVIVQHASLVVLFILTWHNLRWWRMPAEALMSLDVALVAVGYFARHKLLVMEEKLVGGRAKSLGNEVVASVYVFGTLWILSPVLKTLTSAWADDSIAAMAVILMIVHAFLHDYGFVYRPTSPAQQTPLQQTTSVQRPLSLGSDFSRVWREVDNPLALNAAMFAAIILASRLETVTHVFAFEFFAITLFMLLPAASKLVFTLSPKIYTVHLTVAVVLGTLYALKHLAPPQMLVVYILGILLVSLVAPWLYLKLQALRTELRGPWDIVHVKRKKRAFSKPGQDWPMSPISPSYYQ